MSAMFWRGALIAGLAFATLMDPAAAQEPLVVSLDEALDLSGVAESSESSDSNPRLIGPRAESAAAEALIGQARLRPNPDVSFEAENFAGSGMFSGLRATEYTLSVGQRLELGSKRGARIEAAEAQADLANLRASLSQAELGYLVRERYITAVAAASRVDLARDIVARNEELARIANLLVEVGREPPLRALRAQAALAEAQAELEAAQAASLAARTGLAALWSEQSAPPLVPSEFPAIVPPGDVLAGCSPLQLEVARATTSAAAAEIARERSLRVPDPTISAGVRRFEESNANAFIVGVSIPLPFSNRNQGNIAAAEANLRAATAREAVALADYEQAVMRARSAYLAAEARVETLSTTSLPQAEEALRLVQIGYSNGRFPLIEVLSAADARDAIRQALIAAQQDRGQAAAELIRLAAQ
ncbi:MAG: TolC family protein [Sphingomonadaceae bacterium]|nr:TolC family protein [Sphingomonadaceae bacterium]